MPSAAARLAGQVVAHEHLCKCARCQLSERGMQRGNKNRAYPGELLVLDIEDVHRRVAIRLVELLPAVTASNRQVSKRPGQRGSTEMSAHVDL